MVLPGKEGSASALGQFLNTYMVGHKTDRNVLLPHANLPSCSALRPFSRQGATAVFKHDLGLYRQSTARKVNDPSL